LTKLKFPWNERARQVEDARKALNAMPRSSELIERFHHAIYAAYPPGFEDQYQALKAGNAAGAEMAIAFLEADPWFFRTGYIKANLARFLKRIPLSNTQVSRLEKVLIKIVDERNTEEFRSYCRLARIIATANLIAALQQRLTGDNLQRRLRAGWMLACIDQNRVSHHV